MANYFGILKSDLVEEHTTEQEHYYFTPETSKIAQEIYANKELSLLFDAARDADPEDLQTVHSMLMALKRKERGQVLDFGNSIPATITINKDGSFSIFLNASLSYERRMQAYLHEMRHIQKDDFFTCNTVDEKELYNKH